MFIVLLGWTLAAMVLRLGRSTLVGVVGPTVRLGQLLQQLWEVWCYDWVSLGAVVENLRRGCRTLSDSDGCPWGAGI